MKYIILSFEFINIEHGCDDQPIFSSIIEFLKSEIINQTEKWNLYAIIRDPISRFVSAFTDLCYQRVLLFLFIKSLSIPKMSI